MAVGFFTHGVDYTLPHPPISQRTVLLLCEVIKRAWQLLKEKPPSGLHLQTAHEDTVTQALVEIIENHLRKNGVVNGFDCALFGKVIREPKITNFDKNHPDKMPDIFFDLKRDHLPVFSDQDGLFVECKPVDNIHPVFSCYCKKGLIRFINGDYAWAMQDALMVGYVKEPYSFNKLTSVLDDTSKNIPLQVTNHTLIDGLETYRSNHNRMFEWLENKGQACSITVSHLWLPM